MSTDAVNVSINVAVSPERAFELFTAEVDLWWRSGPVYRTSKHSNMVIEPGIEGRVLDVHSRNGTVREIGKVLVWEPGVRLQFEWRGVNFEPDQVTYIDVSFKPDAHNDGTEVHVRHYGWNSLPADHPVFHGALRSAFNNTHARWWANLLNAFGQRAT